MSQPPKNAICDGQRSGHFRLGGRKLILPTSRARGTRKRGACARKVAQYCRQRHGSMRRGAHLRPLQVQRVGTRGAGMRALLLLILGHLGHHCRSLGLRKRTWGSDARVRRPPATVKCGIMMVLSIPSRKA